MHIRSLSDLNDLFFHDPVITSLVDLGQKIIFHIGPIKIYLSRDLMCLTQEVYKNFPKYYVWPQNLDLADSMLNVKKKNEDPTGWISVKLLLNEYRRHLNCL